MNALVDYKMHVVLYQVKYILFWTLNSSESAVNFSYPFKFGVKIVQNLGKSNHQ